jgi:ribosomal protein S18 acetylase RimI-like enzyme
MIERFSDDTPHDGSFVIKAAALELQRRGTPLWIGADLSPAALCRREGDCSITGFLGDTAVAAMVRSDWDPEHLPELKKSESTFVHKLGVLPAYQGRGGALEMLEYAATISQARGISHTRLDCAADRPKLCGVYESAGYVKVAERVVGAYPIAFFARALGARLFLSGTEG